MLEKFTVNLTRLISAATLAILVVLAASPALSAYRPEANRPVINLMPKAAVDKYVKVRRKMEDLRNNKDIREAERAMFASDELVKTSGCTDDGTNDGGCQRINAQHSENIARLLEIQADKIEPILKDIRSARRAAEPQIRKMTKYSLRQVQQSIHEKSSRRNPRSAGSSMLLGKIGKLRKALGRDNGEGRTVKGAKMFVELSTAEAELEAYITSLRTTASDVRTGQFIGDIFSQNFIDNIGSVLDNVLGAVDPEGTVPEPVRQNVADYDDGDFFAE